LKKEVPGVEKKVQKEKQDIPDHVQTFDPEKPLYETFHVCIYLSELEDEKEKNPLGNISGPMVHK
jgi:hypothetical protein